MCIYTFTEADKPPPEFTRPSLSDEKQSLQSLYCMVLLLALKISTNQLNSENVLR